MRKKGKIPHLRILKRDFKESARQMQFQCPISLICLLSFFLQFSLESKIPRMNKIWLMLTISSYIHSFDESGNSAWENIETQNFRAERNLQITWLNKFPRSIGKEGEILAWMESKMKTIQPRTRLGSDRKVGTENIRRFQMKQARPEDPRQCISYLLLYDKLLPKLVTKNNKHLLYYLIVSLSQ